MADGSTSFTRQRCNLSLRWLSWQNVSRNQPRQGDTMYSSPVRVLTKLSRTY